MSWGIRMKILACGRFFVLLILASISTNQISAGAKPIKVQEALVKLGRFEVVRSKVGIQLLFDFAKNTPIKPVYDENSLTLSLFFPRVLPHEFETNKNWKRLEGLSEQGLLSSVSLDRTDAPQGSVLKLQFPREKTLKNGVVVQNELFVKWSLVENRGTRLIVNSFACHALKKLKARVSKSVLYATNDVVQNDFLPVPGIKQLERRIIVDAGHGGTDLGAKGCGNVYEKDIALQVVKLLEKKLKAEGFKVHLTRNDDKNISLASRNTLAHQLKADAFISIHLNSSGKIGSDAKGVETYFLAQDGVLPPTHVGGYYFVNTKKDQALIDTLNRYMQDNIELSKNLATCVQSDLVGTLRANKMPTRNRGVKSAHLRLLVRNNLPTALVEIGFITNPEEKARLASKKGQNVVADGIVNGIKRYFEGNV